MRKYVIFAIMLSVALPSLGQRRGGGFGSRGPSVGRPSVGGPAFHGPTFGGPAFGGPTFRTGFPQRFSSFGRGWGSNYRRSLFWPSYGGGFYGSGYYGAAFYGGYGYGCGFGCISGFSSPPYSYPYASPWAQPDVYSYAPPPSPAQPIVIVINEPAPVPRYETVSLGPPPPGPDPPTETAEPYHPVTYPIRFKDGRTVTALAFWMNGGMLHYVTRDYGRHAVPLSSVQRARFEDVR